MPRPPSILVSFVLLALFAPSVRAQVVPVGPFTGALSEGFEGAPNGAYGCVPGRVFANTGDLCTPGSHGCNITSGWGFICNINPYAGNNLCGSATGYIEYTFDAPVQR